jgi:hypothetical protein
MKTLPDPEPCPVCAGSILSNMTRVEPYCGTCATLARAALATQFGAAYRALADAGQRALVRDLLEMAVDEYGARIDDAARVLRQNLGGPKNLASYVRCLLIPNRSGPTRPAMGGELC